MTESFTTAKAIVNDMVNRKAKFGSFKAAKQYLDNTYKYQCQSKATQNDYFGIYYDKNGKEVAYVDECYCVKGIKDKTGTTDIEYRAYCNNDSFSVIKFQTDDLDCQIEDTNHNGIVDKDDRITYSPYPEECDMDAKVSVFLKKTQL